MKRPWSKAERKLLLLSIGGLLAAIAGVTWSSFRPAGNGVPWSGSAYPLVALAWSPDSKMVAAAGAEPGTLSGSTVCVWQVPSGHLKSNIPGHQAPIEQLEFSPDSLYLLGYSPNSVNVWNSKTGNLEKSLQMSQANSHWEGQTTLLLNGTISTRISPKKMSSRFGQMRLDTRKSTLTTLPPPTSLSNPIKKETSPGGRFALVSLLPVPGVNSGVATSSKFVPNRDTGRLELIETRLENPLEIVRLVRVRDNKLLKTLSSTKFKLLWWRDARHLQGVFLVGVGSLFKGVRLWTLDCQTMQESWQPLEMKSFDNVCVSPDKHWLSCNERAKVYLFDLKRNVLVATWETDPDSRTQSAFAPDSRHIAWIDGNDVRVQELNRFAS